MIQRDKIVVVDIEATCWKNHKAPPGQQSEIIEIGVCVLDVNNLQVSDKQSILVKPTRSKVGEFCTSLTTLTQEQVSGGLSFSAACQQLQDEYDTKSRLWGSWGDYDRKMFDAQCETFSVTYPFSQNHVNLKALFAILVNEDKQIGMARAMRKIGLKAQGTPHRGHDDAWNTAHILVYLLKQCGVNVLSPYW